MSKIGKSVIVALVLGIVAAGVSGCEKKEGPLERAGKSMDKAADKTGQQIDKAVEKTGDKLEKAGDKIKESVK